MYKSIRLKEVGFLDVLGNLLCWTGDSCEVLSIESNVLFLYLESIH